MIRISLPNSSNSPENWWWKHMSNQMTGGFNSGFPMCLFAVSRHTPPRSLERHDWWLYTNKNVFTLHLSHIWRWIEECSFHARFFIKTCPSSVFPLLSFTRSPALSLSLYLSLSSLVLSDLTSWNYGLCGPLLYPHPVFSKGRTLLLFYSCMTRWLPLAGFELLFLIGYRREKYWNNIETWTCPRSCKRDII